MKRGWLVSIVMFLLNLPIVLADDSILGLLLGTSDDSAIFLRVIYAAMLFVFIYKVSKESIFPDDKQRKLALVFSLAFVFFIQHSTSDEVISTFGWLIAFIGPFIILYGLTGVFSGKDAKGKFTWTRFIIALVATGVLFFILMASNAFSGLIIDTPYVGGFFDEMFHDASYYIFGGLGPIGLFLMASLLLLGLMLLTGRMGGGSNKLGNLPGWLWWLIGTILIVVLLGLFGADVLSVLIPGLEYLKYLLLAAALLVPLVYILKDKRRRDRLWAWIKANPWIWWVILAIAIIILLSIFGKSLLGLLLQYWWVLVGLALLLLLIYFRKGIGRGIRGDNVYVDVVYWQIAAPANPRPAPVLRTIRHNTIGGDRTLRFYPRDPQQEVSFRVYRGRARRLWRRPLENANLTLVLQNANGGFNPLNGTTNANGELRLQFVPGNNIGNNQLTLQVIHPEIPRVRPIQPYPIQIGVLGPAPTVRLNPVSPIAVNEGQDAVFFVEVVDAGGNGNNFNRATVDVTFTPANPTQPIPVPVNGITTAGAVGIPARLQVTVPGLTQRGEPYTLVANVTNINGYANPGQLNGQIDVNAPVVNPLNVQLRQANINANVGDDVYIIVEVRENAGGPGIDTPIQIRFPNHGGLVNINGNAIGGTPGTPSVFTVGPIPGLTVGNSPYPFEVTVTAPPAGFRAPGVVNGVININAVVQPLLTIASPQVTIYEGDPAFLTMLVSDPNGDGVNCTVEIFSNRFGLIQGNAVGGGPGIPARFVNPRPINGLTAANSPYNYDYRVLNAPGYTIPAPQQSQIIINGAQLRINLVQITTTIDEGQDANFIVEVEDTNGNGVNVPINIRFDNNASPEINGTSQGAGRGVPGRMQVRVPGLINAQSPYIYHTTLTRVPAQYQNPGVVDGQIIVNPAPQLIPLTVRVLPQGINIQEGQDAEIIAEVEDPQGNGVDVIIEIRSRNQAVPNVRGNTQGGRLHTPSVFQMNPIQGLTAVNSPYPFEILIQPPQGYSINGLLREQIIVNAVPQQGLNVRVRNQGLTIRQGQNAQITVEVLDQNGNGVDNVQLEITAPSQLIPDVGGTTQNGGAHTPSTFPTNPIPNLVTRDSPYSFLVRIVGVPQGFVIPNPINREIIVTGGGGGPHKPGFTKRFLNLLRKDDALSYLLKSSYTRGTHTTKLRQLENYVQSLNITNWNQEDVRKLNQYMTKARNLYADLIALNNEHFTPIKKILIKIEPGLVATHVEKMINDINYLQNNLNLADYNKLITEFYDREQPPSIIRDRLKMMTDTAKLKTQSLEGAIRAVEKLVQKNP